MGARTSSLRFPSRSSELPASNCFGQSHQALVANTKGGTNGPTELFDHGSDNLPDLRKAEICRPRTFTLTSVGILVAELWRQPRLFDEQFFRYLLKNP